MKYAIVAAALFSSVLANPAWAPPAGYSQGSWGTSSAPAAPSYPAPASSWAAPSSAAAPSYPAPPAGGWSSAPAAPECSTPAAPVYSSPAAPTYGTSTVEVTTEVTVTSCAASVTDCPAGGSWGSSAAPVAPYPSPSGGSWGSSPAAPAPAYPTGTAPAAPAQSTWAPVPATGAGSTAQTGGILAAAGALFALFL